MNRLEITPDKQYLAVAGHPHIRLYDIHSSNPNPLTSFDGHSSNVTALGFQKDRKWYRPSHSSRLLPSTMRTCAQC